MTRHFLHIRPTSSFRTFSCYHETLIYKPPAKFPTKSLLSSQATTYMAPRTRTGRSWVSEMQLQLRSIHAHARACRASSLVRGAIDIPVARIPFMRPRSTYYHRQGFRAAVLPRGYNRASDSSRQMYKHPRIIDDA